jgi:membrane protease YdiL (CAAX protease family)
MAFLQIDLWTFLYYALLLGVAVAYTLTSPNPKNLPPFFAKQKFKIEEVTILLFLSGILLHYGRASVSSLNQNSIFNAFVAALAETLYPPIVLIAVWLFFHFRLRESLTVIGFSRREWIDNVLLGLKWVLAIYTVFFLFFFLIFSISGDEVHVRITGYVIKSSHGLASDLIKDRVNLLGLPVAILELTALLVFGSGIEEILFRGVYYSALRKKFNALPATLLSSALFTMSHGRFSWDIFVTGCLAAYLYERTYSLVPSITAHIADNLYVFIFAIFAPVVLRRLDTSAFLAFNVTILSTLLFLTWMVSYYLNKAKN